MKKLTLLFLCLLLWHIGFSQTLTPEVYTTSGDYFTNANSSLSWTLGEPIIETYSNSNNILTQGFQQSSYNVTAIENITNNNFLISLYPNPTSGLINICAESSEMKKLKIDLIDITGKQISSITFQNNVQLNLIDYSSGLYLMHISDENNNSIQTFKVEKINQ